MGKKSSSSTSGPSKQALPWINSASNAVQGAYNANAGNVADITKTLQNNLPGVLGSTLNNPTLGAAGSYDQDVLSGKYLTGNPYLDAQIKATNQDVTNTVNGSIGTRGLTGGSAQTQLLTDQLAKNENNLRYTDYTNERNNMNAAAGNATSVAGAQTGGIQALIQYLTAQAGIPQEAADNYAQSIAGLWGNSQTKTSTPSTASSIEGGIGTALKIGSAIFSDRRLKRSIRKLGEASDGLGVYAYRYLWGGPEHRGVMADEVAQIRPWALGERVNGFQTVNYGAL